MTATPSELPAGLVAEAISAGYPGRPVLSGVSARVTPGALIAVIGPNGAGKSTLLRVLAGTLSPTLGAVRIDGEPMTSLSRGRMARRIAVVPQQLTIGFGLTAREVVMLGRTPYFGFLGVPSHADRQAVERAMIETDTTDFATRPFSTLSGGEAQRVVLAMALAQETDYLLLDEPTVHLDLGQQWRLITHLLNLRASRNVGILAVIHDLSLAGTAFDRVLLMKDGRIAAEGTPREVLTPDNIRHGFQAPVEVWQDESGVRVALKGSP